MLKLNMVVAVAATVLLATGCAKKEEAMTEAAATAEAAPPAEAAAPAADAAAAPAADAPAAPATADEDASQSGGDKVRP
jgi:hypothetical protein